MKNLYNLPSKVNFVNFALIQIKDHVLSRVFFIKDKKNAEYLKINNDGICDACKVAELKKKINWKQRKKELYKLLDKFRKNNGDYDCIVREVEVKIVYMLLGFSNMNLEWSFTVTWPPILYTEYGYKNYLNWIEIGGFDNITYKQNGRVMKLLTRLSIKNLLHPFQTFILGQKNIAPLIAKIQYTVNFLWRKWSWIWKSQKKFWNVFEREKIFLY